MNLINEGLNEYYTSAELSLVDQAIEALEFYGIPVPVSGQTAAGLLMIAEACNLAAKELDYAFYNVKAAVIDAAIAAGCTGGWGQDGVFYLHHPETGVACFHDPNEEITACGEWEHPWSGIYRQDHAFSIMADSNVRRIMAESTSPYGKLAGIRPATVSRIIRRVI